jgi:Tol biopolymer transport system component
VLDATRGRRPLPGWLAWLGSDWVGDRAPVAFGRSGIAIRPTTLLLVLALAVAVVGSAIFVGGRVVHPAPEVARPDHLAYAIDGDLYVADWDGTHPVRIADGDLNHGYWHPRWSSDGSHLLYEEAASDGSIVHISDARGEVRATFPGWISAWSPDGLRIATWAAEFRGIDIYGLDGGLQSRIDWPTELVSGEQGPIWSPDGTRIVVPERASNGDIRLWSLPLSGDPPGPLSAETKNVFGPVFSPDGTALADDSEAGLVVSASDGTRPRVLVASDTTGFPIADPVWSQSSDRIVVGWGRGFGADEKSLRLVDAATAEAITLTSGRFWGIRPLGWSPGGDRILFAMTELNELADAGRTSLWVINADGSDLQRLVDGAEDGDWQRVPVR